MAKVSIQRKEEIEAMERRRSERTDFLVRVDYSTIDELFSEFTRDINEGGLFIETDKPHAAGTLVSMQFNLPGSDEPIRTTGRVVRINDSEADGPLGMGIEFDELTADDRQHINRLIRALRTGVPDASGGRIANLG